MPSIRDVAAVAGVSYQTVSRVLNDSPRVRPETRRQVLAAMQQLGYRPNRAARALGLGRARAVTVVTSNTTLYGYAATLQGIEEAARASAFSVGISVLESADEVVDRVIRYRRSILAPENLEHTPAQPGAGTFLPAGHDTHGRR